MRTPDGGRDAGALDLLKGTQNVHPKLCSGFGFAHLRTESTIDGSSIGEGSFSETERLEADAIGRDQLHIGQAETHPTR